MSSIFNTNSRTNNVIKTSAVSVGCNVLNTLFSFIYRTIFLYVLSANYLGISGLFTNILQILSIAELGITNAITYRFYKPIKESDVEKVGQLMNFFKFVYRIIAATIVIFGMSLYPFLDNLIGNASEVPADVNLHLVYILYLLQSVSSYFYAYKQVILSADQKQYTVSVLHTIVSFLKYLVQIVALIVLRNFTISLATGIVVTIATNFAISLWVDKQYRPVFKIKSQLSGQEKKQILFDTKATMCHKIGGTVLSSTDNIVLTKFVSLVVTGYYANYTIITNGLNAILTQLLGNFTSSFGNAHVSLGKERNKEIFEKMFFVNSFFAGAASVLLFELINSFISMWVGPEMLLNKVTVGAVCAQFYFESGRQVAKSFTNGCGLFVKDQLRPIIQSIINIVVSIVFVKQIGLPGVFIGTIVSHLVTVFWREPYLLYKYEFEASTRSYWLQFAKYTMISLGVVCACEFAKQAINYQCNNIFVWIIEAVIIFGLFTAVFIGINWKDEHCIFFRRFVCKKVKFLKRLSS